MLDGCDALNRFHLNLEVDSIDKDVKDLILMDDYNILIKGTSGIFGSEKIAYCFDFEIYDTFQDYILNTNWSGVYEKYKDIPLDEIYEIQIFANIRDFSNLPNLKKISVGGHTNPNRIDFKSIENLEEIVIGGQLTGNIDLSKNKRLMILSVYPEGDVSNYHIDLSGMYWLKELNIGIDGTKCQNFDLNKFVLVDDYSDFVIYESDQDQDGVTDYVSYHKYGKFFYTIEDFYNYESEKHGIWTSPEDVEILHLGDLIIEDYSGIGMFTNLRELVFENFELPNIDLSQLENLESVEIKNCLLNRTLNFSENKKLNTLYVDLHGDLTNAAIDIRGMDWLEQFKLSHYQSTNFNLRNSILTYNYNILSYWTHEDTEKGKVEEYSFSREIYNNIDEYLEAYYSETAKEEITKLQIWYNVSIKDYSGLSTLTNLTDISFYYTNLESIDFEVVSKLENIYVYGCTLNGTLDFTGNTNLKNIDINLSKDLTNSVIDIRGLNNLEHFSYEYYTDQATGFNLNTCILRDNTLELTHNSDTESMYEGYHYNNYPEDPDEPIYPEDPNEPIEPEYPEYIISNLNTYEIEDGTSIIYGFVLNDEKILTLGDIQTREYFAEGITARIFKNGIELTSTQEIVGTGTIIKLYQEEELVEEYTIVIYGDSTGDGKINAVDALAIIKNKNQKLLFENKVLEEAGRVTEKSYINEATPSAVDALAIIKYLNSKYDIDQRYYW